MLDECLLLIIIRDDAAAVALALALFGLELLMMK